MSEPTWVPCVKRQEVELHRRDGSIGRLARCAHQACSRFNTELKPEDCAGCPMRMFTKTLRPPGYIEREANNRDFGEPRIMDDGTLVYPRNGGWEPPKLPTGYRRKSDDLRSDDAWVFIPEWPPCIDREMANTVMPCGCIKINAICASSASGRHAEQVQVSDCLNCPVRRVLVELEQVDVKQCSI